VRSEYEQLVQIVDTAMAEAMRLGGEQVQCRAGCMECCVGPIAITNADAMMLAERFAEFALTNPEAAADIAERAGRSWKKISRDFAAEHLPPEETPTEQAWLERHLMEACPALHPETGACRIHAIRPLTCRLYGPAIRTDGIAHRHCRLNYVGMTAEEIEPLRVAVDPGPMGTAVAAAAKPGRRVLVSVLAAFARPPHPTTQT
jgi:Fe-S-cluster containining protein